MVPLESDETNWPGTKSKKGSSSFQDHFLVERVTEYRQKEYLRKLLLIWNLNGSKIHIRNCHNWPCLQFECTLNKFSRCLFYNDSMWGKCFFDFPMRYPLGKIRSLVEHRRSSHVWPNEMKFTSFKQQITTDWLEHKPYVNANLYADTCLIIHLTH